MRKAHTHSSHNIRLKSEWSARRRGLWLRSLSILHPHTSGTRNVMSSRHTSGVTCPARLCTGHRHRRAAATAMTRQGRRVSLSRLLSRLPLVFFLVHLSPSLSLARARSLPTPASRSRLPSRRQAMGAQHRTQGSGRLNEHNLRRHLLLSLYSLSTLRQAATSGEVNARPSP